MLSDQSNSQELKGKFFISELDVPPLGESNLIGPKKSHPTKVRHTKHENLIFMFFVTDFCWTEKLLLYPRAPTMLGKYARYDEK